MTARDDFAAAVTQAVGDPLTAAHWRSEAAIRVADAIVAGERYVSAVLEELAAEFDADARRAGGMGTTGGCAAKLAYHHAARVLRQTADGKP